MKDDGLLERNQLAGPEGDAVNVILSVAGHNMRLLPRWLRLLVFMILAKILCGAGKQPEHQPPPDTKSPEVHGQLA
jgi:IS5 family transposase